MEDYRVRRSFGEHVLRGSVLIAALFIMSLGIALSRQGRPGSLPHLLHALCAQPGIPANHGNRHHPHASEFCGRAGGPAEKTVPSGSSAPDSHCFYLRHSDGFFHVAHGTSGTGRIPVVRYSLPVQLRGHRVRRLSSG